MTAKRIFAFIILVPIAVILIAFIVANRAMVALTLNPFQPNDDKFTYHAPFFIWLFVFLIIGMIIGSLITWFTQHKYRKSLKSTKAELENLKTQATKNNKLPQI